MKYCFYFYFKFTAMDAMVLRDGRYELKNSKFKLCVHCDKS